MAKLEIVLLRAAAALPEWKGLARVSFCLTLASFGRPNSCAHADPAFRKTLGPIWLLCIVLTQSVSVA